MGQTVERGGVADSVRREPLAVALVGGGAIARVIARRLVDEHPEVRLVGALDIDPAGARERGFAPEVPLVDSLDALLALGPSFVAECAGHAGLLQHGPGVLRAGLDLVVASVGALADARLEGALREAAAAGGARMRIPSGAIGALDALASARVGGLEQVGYTGRKPPLAWRGTRAETVVDLDRIVEATRIFEGSAREAALAYPQNANVCAAVGLAGVGMDETRVELYADPQARGNEHRLQAAGAFGELRFEVVGRPLAGNPKTSSLAAYSLIKTLVAPARAIAVG
ncbi:MAG: aspartate dehydrogenase [Pseudomonadota bacterium]|jgi:aspartate dehydrogenase